MWFLKPNSRGKTGMQGRWSEGIWIGVKDESNEAIVANRDGVYKARSIMRKATQAEKWKMSGLNEVDCIPWNEISEERDDSIKVDFPDQGEEVHEVPNHERRELEQETSKYDRPM